MYLPRMIPICENALFKPLARLPIPAVAANATRARIRRYSTKPCPASSLCSRAREVKTKVIIDVVSSECFLLDSQRAWGPRRIVLWHVYRQIDGQSAWSLVQFASRSYICVTKTFVVLFSL